FLDAPVRLLAALLELAEARLVRVALALLVELAVRELQRGVAVALLGAMAEDQVGGGFHHGDGDGRAVRREHGGHADLLADQTLHDSLLRLPRAHRARGRGCGRPPGRSEALRWPLDGGRAV